jgi:hypothetical protein
MLPIWSQSSLCSHSPSLQQQPVRSPTVLRPPLAHLHLTYPPTPIVIGKMRSPDASLFTAKMSPCEKRSIASLQRRTSAFHIPPSSSR